MASRRSVRRYLALMGAALWMLTLSAGAVLADQAPACEVNVSPVAAASGSVFVFTGTGFQPSELTLRKVGGSPINHDLNVGAEPWEVSVRSRIGDEGTWTATFLDPSGDCTATVGFRVTLTSTDVVADLAKAAGGGPGPLVLYLAVVVFGFGGGVVLGRRINSRVGA